MQNADLGTFPLEKMQTGLSNATDERALAELLERARKNEAQSAQNAAVMEAERLAAKVAAEMAGNAIDTVQGAVQNYDVTPSGDAVVNARYASVSEQAYRDNLESVELGAITPEEAAIELFTKGLELKRTRESSTITTANNPNPNDFGLAA